MNIDIKKLDVIKDELDELKQEDVLYIDENGCTKYAIIPSNSMFVFVFSFRFSS